MSKNPILVTGIHRSGSTFTGKMLSLNKNIGYIQEPFNKDYGLKIFDTNYKYVTQNNISSNLLKAIDDLIKLKKANYHIPSIINDHSSVANKRALIDELLDNFKLNLVPEFSKRLLFKSSAQLSFYFAKYHPAVDRILLKDPLACFASQYLHKTFNVQVVILIRHPLSFAGSLKRLNWGFNFDTFLKQDELMDRHLQEYKDEMIVMHQHPTTIIENACMVWNCIYTVLSRYIKNNPSFIVCTHEEIATQPLETFKMLYSKLELNYTTKIEEKIGRYTSEKNPVKAKKNRVHQLKRDSVSIINKWKDILTDDEIDYVQNKTAAVSNNFYDESFFKSVSAK